MGGQSAQECHLEHGLVLRVQNTTLGVLPQAAEGAAGPGEEAGVEAVPGCGGLGEGGVQSHPMTAPTASSSWCARCLEWQLPGGR